jgi:hypothetical protein
MFNSRHFPRDVADGMATQYLAILFFQLVATLVLSVERPRIHMWLLQNHFFYDAK